MKTYNIAKRRDAILSSARELFLQNGEDNVTMSDIAHYSGKHRRTIYLYFNNKHEIYIAVIQQELEKIVNELNDIVTHNIAPKKKLEMYVYRRFDLIKEAINNDNNLLSDYWDKNQSIDGVRTPLDVSDIRMIRKMLEEGISQDVFKKISPQLTAIIISNSLKGLENIYMNDNMSFYIQKEKSQIIDILLKGLLKDKNVEG